MTLMHTICTSIDINNDVDTGIGADIAIDL